MPIISTDQEFVVKHGINGYIVPQKDPRAIANAVVKLYDEHKCKIMGNMSREIIKQYDWRIIAKKAIGEYEKLMSK